MHIARMIKIIIVLAALAVAQAAWAQRGAGWSMRQAMGQGRGQGMCQTLLSSLPKQSLDATETAELTYLREEEKLARDIYVALDAKWGKRALANISTNEQRRRNTLGMLLDRYNLPDPTTGKSAGVFQNSGLQALYTDLSGLGTTSFPAAMRVGATLEDLLLRDLGKALAATDNKDLKMVYQNLQNGSQNHLRMFVGQLEANGESYAAQYISNAALAEILSKQAAGTNCADWCNGPKRIGCANCTCPWRKAP